MTDTETKTNENTTPAKGGFLGWLTGLPGAWKNYLAALTHEPRTRFLTILWAVCIIFLGISILSGANPFQLLIPGQVFPRPSQDTRPNVELLGVSRVSNELVAYKRRMQPGESIEASVTRVAYMVSEPVGLRESLSGNKNLADLEPLPRLGFAVRRVWFRKDSGELVLDFRRETLLKDTSLFHKNRHRASVVPAEQNEVKKKDDDEEDDKVTRRKKREKKNVQLALAGYLDGYFRSLTASIFASQAEVKSVLYLLDGESDTIDEMEFDLDVKYTR